MRLLDAYRHLEAQATTQARKHEETNGRATNRWNRRDIQAVETLIRELGNAIERKRDA